MFMAAQWHCWAGNAIPVNERAYPGAEGFSSAVRVAENGDVMEIELAGFGRALRNPVRVDGKKQQLVRVNSV